MTRSALRYALSIAAATLFGLLLSWSPLGAQLDLWAYDLLLRLNPPAPERSATLILSIDEESLQSFGGMLRLREPLARALSIVAAHDPAVVAVDIVLSEDRPEQENQALAAAFSSLPRLVLAANLRPGGEGWEAPARELALPHAVVGHVHAEPDVDGVCRRLLLAKAVGRTRRWAMALEAWRLASGADSIEESPASLRLGALEIPSSQRSERELLIRFANPQRPIERLPLKRILDDPGSAAVVRGRPVFVGVQLLGGPDQYLMTPYSFGKPMTGVEINANVYETLARGRYLQAVPASLSLACALLLAVGVGLCFWRLTGRAMLWTASGLLAAAHALPAIAFAQLRIWPSSEPVLVGWSCLLVGGAFHYLVVRRNLDRAERQTERYQRAVHYVTHEMRTPLTAIQGSSELISRYRLSEEKRRQIGELIHAESQRLGRMIETFLGVERLSSGELSLRRESVDMDALLSACIARVAAAAGRKRIQIERRPGRAGALLGDREFLDYACYNLISNAVKYSPADTAITVRAWCENHQVLVSIEDQGYGMDASDLPNIFKKFYRARTAQKSGESGTGLGLALVEEIIVQHGGSIAVESEVGRGSRFTLTLPVAGVVN